MNLGDDADILLVGMDSIYPRLKCYDRLTGDMSHTMASHRGHVSHHGISQGTCLIPWHLTVLLNSQCLERRLKVNARAV